MQKLSARQLVLISCGLTLDATLISIPAQMVKVAGHDAVFCYFIAMALIVLSWIAIVKTVQRFPGQDLFSALTDRFPFIGKVIGLSYVAFFFLILTRDLRSIASFVNYSLLPRTPLSVIIAVLGVCVALTVRSRLKGVGRMTEIYQTSLLIIILLLPVLLFKEVDYRWMQPLFSHSITDVLHGSWYAVAYLGEIVAIPFLLSSSSFPVRHGLYGLLIGVAMLEGLLVLCIAVLSPEITSRFLFPNYHLIREIRITDFLDRFDVAIVGVWLPAVMVKIACTLYFVCHGIRRIFPSLQFEQIVTPVSVFTVACSMWLYANYNQILHFNAHWPVLGLLFEVLIPIVMYFVLRPKVKSTALAK
ncbi:endospore germination permease [Paenibacillus chartarius]|uniref:Endospore germination permease n=1 Tax=Paenibacillus chartarius TaxID=747481 RepID=A0ABV6DH77_9BACL